MQLDTNKIEFAIVVEQDFEPVRGNAMASGDDAIDRQVEDEILARLDSGDVWAWADVTVEARYKGIPDIVGRDRLGCCSYRDENEFCQPGGYYDDMKAGALADLQSKLEDVARIVCESQTNRLAE